MKANIETEIVRACNGESLRVVLGDREYFLPFKMIAGRKVGFLDISGQVSLIESAADEIVALLEGSGISFDTILNPVSKSNALAHAIAVRWARKHPELTHTVVARKSSDAANEISATYRSVTTDKDQTISLTPDDASYLRGKSVLFVDDVYGAGGTTRALKELAEKAGAHISAHCVVGIEEGTDHPEDLIYLFGLPVIS